MMLNQESKKYSDKEIEEARNNPKKMIKEDENGNVIRILDRLLS